MDLIYDSDNSFFTEDDLIGIEQYEKWLYEKKWIEELGYNPGFEI